MAEDNGHAERLDLGRGVLDVPTPSRMRLFGQSAFEEESSPFDMAAAQANLWPRTGFPFRIALVAILGLAVGIVVLELVARTAGVNSDSEAVARAVAPLLRRAWPFAFGLAAVSFLVLVAVGFIRGSTDLSDLPVLLGFDEKRYV